MKTYGVKSSSTSVILTIVNTMVTWCVGIGLKLNSVDSSSSSAGLANLCFKGIKSLIDVNTDITLNGVTVWQTLD